MYIFNWEYLNQVSILKKQKFEVDNESEGLPKEHILQQRKPGRCKFKR